MIAFLTNYCMLPKTVTEFEDSYLRRINRIALVFFTLHLPAFVLLAWLNETGPALAFLLTVVGLVGPYAAIWAFESKRAVSQVFGFTMVYMCGLLIHFGQGPVQIEMHFYFFVGVSLLAAFGNPMVIIVATLSIAVHHIALYFLLPSSVFNYEASLLVLSVHVVFAVAGAIGSIFLGRTFFDNVILLERKVKERTREIEKRSSEIRTLLDAVHDGFLTLDAECRLIGEKTKAVELLLGPIEDDQTFTDVIAQYDPEAADWLGFSIREVFETFLPVEVAIDQLPERIFLRGKYLSLRFAPVFTDGEMTYLTTVISDVTAEAEKEKLEAESRELLSMLERISSDQNGFFEFIQEAGALIKAIREERDDLQLLQHRLHTLKGNASIFGITRLAKACHAIEDQLEEQSETRDGNLWTELFGCWSTVQRNFRRLVPEDLKQLRLTDEQYNELLFGLLKRKPVETLAPKLAAWKLDSTEERLKTISLQAKQLAQRLGKGTIRVKIASNGLRTEGALWGSFWGAMVHVVRNAIDHGLETIEDRRLAGKSDYGQIVLSTRCIDGKFVISLADDGQGIDWDKIAEVAESKGMPSATHEDLINALFADGLSTRSESSEISGRGVGMSAVKQACEYLDGKIEVLTTSGHGTEFRFTFPELSMAPRTHQLFQIHDVDANFRDLVKA